MMNEEFFETLTTKQLANIARILGSILERRSIQLLKGVNEADLKGTLEN